MGQWPTNAAVLIAALHVAERRRDVPARIDALQRLLQIEPDNAALERTLAATRAELTAAKPA